MSAVSTDGVTVIQRHANSVHAKLKMMIQEETADNNPRNSLILSICMAHKLNLVVAAQSGKILQLADSLVMERHHIFGSTLRVYETKSLQQTGQKNVFPSFANGSTFQDKMIGKPCQLDISTMYPVLLESLQQLQNKRLLTHK
ncbi:hypothetical protein Aduo_019043 [Ancylostoma duodenale]